MSSSLGALTHVQFFVTSADRAVHVAALWLWATEGVPLPPLARAVVVTRLPRGASIEIVGLAERRAVPVDDDSDEGGTTHEERLGDNPFWHRPGLFVPA